MRSQVAIAPRSERMASVESYRVVAIFIVVCLHTNFITRLHLVGGGYGFLVDMPLYLLFWMAVPYFFLAAGYFFGRKVRGGSHPLLLLRGSCTSLLLVFVIWVMIYSFLGRSWISNFYHQGIWPTLSAEAVQTASRLRSDHITLLLIPRPPIYHLWFLPALMAGLGTVAVVLTRHLEKVVVSLCLFLYVLTVACEVLPLDVLRAYPPGMLLIGMLFTVMGWWVSREGAISNAVALKLMAGGFVLALVEGAILKKLVHASSYQVIHYPYAGAVLLVLGIFLFTLANPTIGQRTILPILARFTLGVYVSHILIGHMLASIHDQLPLYSTFWHFVYTLAVYWLSVLLTWSLLQIPGVRLAVTR
jgi:surface polysaccharide O-acyltransferase-like enzyme